MRVMITARSSILAILAMTLSFAVCYLKVPPMTGAFGAATLDELINHYEDAHRTKDIKKIRPLLFVNSDWLARHGGSPDDDAAMLEICSHPLVRVDLDVGPGPRGSVVTTQASFHLPGKPGSRKLVRIGGSFVTKDSNYYCGGGGVTVPEGRSDGVLENIYGKLIVVVDKDTAVDPSYVVIKCDGRYYINPLEFVLLEAADALKSGRKPQYIADPLGHLEKVLPLD